MKSRVIVIAGPTASGKTSLSISLAKALDGEIVSADSMQVYREMNIGTAKPTAQEMQGIPHHMIDIIDPDELYNVSKYKTDAEGVIKDILDRSKQPIVVGGTGLYIDSLVKGIEFANVKNDIEYRNELIEKAEHNGPESIFEMLKNIDPESAQTIDMNNIRRVARALEIYKVTGKTKTQIDRESIKDVPYDYKIFALDWSRDVLYDRINIRIDKMIEDGLIDEVKDVIKKYSMSSTAMQGLGYKEVVEYLNNKLTFDEMIEKLKMETRRYAKRQLTWFRKNENIEWIEPAYAFETILNKLKNN